MKLKLVRTDKTAESTIGALYIDGAFECYTLEDTERPDGVKIYGETAIPRGAYTVDITVSPRFKRDLPLLVGVKNYVGVRIHPGNTASDTEGCILVGRRKGKDRIEESRLAFDSLFTKLQAARKRGEAITIEVGS